MPRTARMRRLITFVKDRPGHDRRYAIDAAKIGRELGWTPARGLLLGPAQDRRVVPREPLLAHSAGPYQGERLGLGRAAGERRGCAIGRCRIRDARVAIEGDLSGLVPESDRESDRVGEPGARPGDRPAPRAGIRSIPEIHVERPECEVTETALPGVVILEPRVFRDDRGYFLETWNQARYAGTGAARAVRAGQPVVLDQGRPPRPALSAPAGAGQARLGGPGRGLRRRRGYPRRLAHVRPLGRRDALRTRTTGRSTSRRGSPTASWSSSDTALFSYKCTEYYAPTCEASLLWDDPDLGHRLARDRPDPLAQGPRRAPASRRGPRPPADSSRCQHSVRARPRALQLPARVEQPVRRS